MQHYIMCIIGHMGRSGSALLDLVEAAAETALVDYRRYPAVARAIRGDSPASADGPGDAPE